MEILNETQVKDLVNDLLENSTDEQILDVWDNHYPGANEILLKPFRIACEDFGLTYPEKITNTYNNIQPEPHSLLIYLSDLFFQVYEFNSTELDKMQEWILQNLDDFEGFTNLHHEIVNIIKLICRNCATKYLQDDSSLTYMECDGIVFFFKEYIF